MIVLAIIGILAAVAIDNIISFRMRIKFSEAKSNLGAIKMLQEAYKAENDTYLYDIRLYPRAQKDLDSNKAPWINSKTKFSIIGFEPRGNVYFSYSVGKAKDGYFLANAYGDLDNDDILSYFTIDNNGNLRQVSARCIY